MTTTLTEFLLARIKEMEQMLLPAVDQVEYLGSRFVEARELISADAEAKRLIVERTAPGFGMNAAFEPSPIVEWILRQLALPYADHPDYRDEWRP